MAEQRWRIELFGGFRAICGERIVTHFESRKIAALFACLALRLRRAQPRELLAEQLWPDEDWDVSRNRLRQGLSSLRQTLEPGVAAEQSVLLTDRSEAGLDPTAVTTDVEEFEAAIASAGRAAAAGRVGDAICFLRQAAALYQGELLPGYYEEWVLAERERLSNVYLDALAHLAIALAETGDLHEAIETNRRLIAAAPLREDAHAGLMRLYAAAGRPAEAQRQYRDLERILRDELGASPSPATRAVLQELRSSAGALAHPPVPPDPSAHAAAAPLPSCDLPSECGAVALGSPFYIERPPDEEFRAAIARQDSIVLVKGPRQIGKTSLLARGLQWAREAGAGVVLTDFQKLDEEQLVSPAALFRTLAEMIVEQAELDVDLEEAWNPRRGWNVNFERLLRREVLGALSVPVVWGLDEVDRLFTCPFSSVVFGLFRSWHNERALNPGGPWHRLTLAIAYATEAHLFISDLNQSPFNVGTRLTLEDFTQGEVMELNRRCSYPLRTAEEVASYCRLVGGHPYLVRRGLQGVMTGSLDPASLEAEACREDGIFGDHLRRMLLALIQSPDLCEAVRAVLRGGSCPSESSFYRLRSAGVLAGDSAAEARPRCGLYAAYLKRHLS